MKYAAIASGSNGNCYYIAKNDTAVLIDAGINSKHIHLRMHNMGLLPTQIKAIFISHEHSDHIKGLSVFCKKYNIPVYLTRGTYAGSKLHLPAHLVHYIAVDGEVSIGDLHIQAIPKFHDAKEPCSFMLSDGQHKIAVLTDIGRPCENVEKAIQHADIVLLEANFDEEMLRTGRYSYYLKNRISSGWGHISNATALALFQQHRSNRVKHLMLTHLSGQNNTVELVEQTFSVFSNEMKVSVATRFAETELFDAADLRNTALGAVG